MKHRLAGAWVVGLIAFSWALTGCVGDDDGATYGESAVTADSGAAGAGDEANDGDGEFVDDVETTGGLTTGTTNGTALDPDYSTTGGGGGTPVGGAGGPVVASGGAELGVTCVVGERLPPTHNMDASCPGHEADVDACGGNGAPTLGTPQFVVDGEVRAWLDTFPADGRINLLIPYEDVDCNLACGLSDELLSGANFEGRVTRELSEQLPCRSSSAPGTCLEATLYVDPYAPGEHTFVFEVADQCGAMSDPLVITVNN